MKFGLALFCVVLLLSIFSCRSTDTSTPANEKYSFTDKKELKVDGRILKLEDTPKTIPEEIVIKDFLYTITAEFDKKYDIFANIDSYVILIRNEKLLFEEGIYAGSYIIHNITTLSKEQYSRSTTAAGEFNPLYYWGYQHSVDEFGLTEYKIVNVDFSIGFATGGMQWHDGRKYNKSFLVGKNSSDSTYKIYDFTTM